jgi:hypothetical protein
LDYANHPKALIKFHLYNSDRRTPFEEHLVEASEYVAGEGKTKLHFTISEEHLPRFLDHFDNIRKKFNNSGITFDISYSMQKSSSDTLAVNVDNSPFRDKEGRLVFRPGGHGALLENLNDLKDDLIYIKNIDNVAPDRMKPDTILYKKILCGFLVELQDRVFNNMKLLCDGDCDSGSIEAIANFAQDRLYWNKPHDWDSFSRENKIKMLIEKLDRPLRVCGMVKNVGDPGGGPFWIKMNDGTVAPQIVEMSQIDFETPEQCEIAQSATHFNPVDLVCGVKNYKGENYDLFKFKDPDSGFITYKYSGGIPLKALEHPGLWNGSMAFWNTIFIEVPITTFNPVKTLNDLLKEQHQQ